MYTEWRVRGLTHTSCVFGLQVRIRYKQKPHNKLIAAMGGRRLHSNELVMRIQPNESLYMTTMSKVPMYRANIIATRPG